MTEELEKLKPSELVHRAMAGVSSGVSGAARAALLNLGLLALVPIARKNRMAASSQPGFQTQTNEQLAGLAERMSSAGGRDPFKEKLLKLQVLDEPNKASVLFERKAKGRAPVDRLRVSRGISPETLAHEVGHATGNSRATHLLRNLSLHARKKPALFLPGLLALTGALGKKDREEPHLLARAAPYVGGAQLAAIVGEETRANVRGARILSKLRYPMPLKNKLKMFIPTSSYLGKAGLLLGAPLGILKGIQAYDRAQKAGQPMSLNQLLSTPVTDLEKTPPLNVVQKKWLDRLS